MACPWATTWAHIVKKSSRGNPFNFLQTRKGCDLSFPAGAERHQKKTLRIYSEYLQIFQIKWLFSLFL